MTNTVKIFDGGYSILPNGDVVTSDGLPRGDLNAANWPEIFGKPLTFRKPTEAEAVYAKRVNSALDRAMSAFAEKVR